MNALDYCSACLAVTDFHTKAYFFASYQEGWGGGKVWIGGEVSENGETLLQVSGEEATVAPFLCMFPLCGRPVYSQMISQMCFNFSFPAF